jgi:hypothetical protein
VAAEVWKSNLAASADQCPLLQVANAYDEFEGQTVIDLGCGTVGRAGETLFRQQARACQFGTTPGYALVTQSVIT